MGKQQIESNITFRSRKTEIVYFFVKHSSNLKFYLQYNFDKSFLFVCVI